jgi:hypothetical protein
MSVTFSERTCVPLFDEFIAVFPDLLDMGSVISPRLPRLAPAKDETFTPIDVIFNARFNFALKGAS